jgi:hypothetical protein
MRKAKCRIQVLLMSFFVVCFTLAIPASSTATSEWFWCHGHSARVQLPERATNMYYMGWGLDFLANSGAENWVHFAIPTPTYLEGRQISARYIRIRFYTGSVDAFISDVHVWNGDTQIRQFTDLPWANGWQTRELDLGALVNFDKGMGVSVKVQAGVEPMSHRVIFSGAGARFEW